MRSLLVPVLGGPVRRRLVCLLTPTLVLAGSLAWAAEWVVLPRKVQPHTRPSPSSSVADPELGYPDAVTETARVRLAAGGATGGHEWVAFTRDGQSLYLPAALLVRKTALPTLNGPGLPIGRETVDRDTPLPLDYKPRDLVRLDERWNFHTDMPKRLRREVAQAAERMFRHARERDGIELRVISAYRSAASQRHNYLRKVARAGLEQSLVAKPGHSEHQLGTTLDVCATDPATALKKEFGETPEGRWLHLNAARHGFRISYTAKNSRQTGYAPEPWHIRYMGKPQKAD